MRLRFPLTSDQLELLLAFEASAGLAELATAMRRDPSVVSRNLQRLAEDAPVIAKQSGRWVMTEAGRSINETTRKFLAEVGRALPRAGASAGGEDFRGQGAVLMIVNAQQHFLDPARGVRSNPHAELNILRLLQHWRTTKRRVVHVRHLTLKPGSPFHPDAVSAAFIPALSPQEGETIIAKSTASAFAGTTLGFDLDGTPPEALVLAGFTANECVDATAKQARDLGFKTYVVADAVAMFDVVGADGQVFRAGDAHALTLAAQHGAARILKTETLL